jgi:hypothetical protein
MDTPIRPTAFPGQTITQRFKNPFGKRFYLNKRVWPGSFAASNKLLPGLFAAMSARGRTFAGELN